MGIKNESKFCDHVEMALDYTHTLPLGLNIGNVGDLFSNAMS
jgi:hypothetical protein